MNSQTPNHLMSSVNTNSLHARGIWASFQTACSVLVPLEKKHELPRRSDPKVYREIGFTAHIGTYWKSRHLNWTLLTQGTDPQWWPCFIRASGFAQVSSCTHQQKHVLPLPGPRGLQILWAHSAQTCLCSADRASWLLPRASRGGGLCLACLQCQPELGEQNVCCPDASGTGCRVEKRPQHCKGMVKERS